MKPSIEQRIAEATKRTEAGCRVALRGLNSDGYAYMRYKGYRHRLHRLAYELKRGPIPEGMVIDHLCRNKRCSEVSHLEVVTHRENCLRGNSPMAQQARQTTCIRGHSLSGANLLIRADGHRACRHCNRLRKRQERSKK